MYIYIYCILVGSCMQHVKTSGRNLGGNDLVFMKTDSFSCLFKKMVQIVPRPWAPTADKEACS